MKCFPQSTASTFWHQWLSHLLCVTISILWIGACTIKEKREVFMNQKQFSLKLTQIDLNDEEGLQELAEEAVNQARILAHTAAKAWHDKIPLTSDKAEFVLRNMAEIAIIPLLELNDPKDVKDKYWLLDTLVTHHITLRDQLLQHLDRLLNDKALIPESQQTGPIEEAPMPSRICDEAFLAIRRLMHFTEDAGEYALNETTFFKLSFEMRDQEIDKFRKDHIWVDFIENLI